LDDFYVLYGIYSQYFFTSLIILSSHLNILSVECSENNCILDAQILLFRTLIYGSPLSVSFRGFSEQ